MNTVSTFKALIVSTLLATSLAFAEPTFNFQPQLVSLLPSYTFIPPGFDDNDNAQIVVSGFFPNTCYKAASPSVRVDASAKKIFVENSAYLYQGFCAQVQVPYMHTVNLNILAAGQYEILMQDEQSQFQKQGVMNIGVATNSAADEHLYAPVQEVSLQGAKLTLRGSFSTECMSLEDVQVLYRANRIVEVLPIAAVREEPGCRNQPTPFEAQVDLKPTVTGTSLIHVRSLNGQSVSRIAEF